MSSPRTRAVVTGAHGYLGRHLADALRQVGQDVTAYDLPASVAQSTERLQGLDVADDQQWSAVDTEVDAVFMFAGRSGTRVSFEQYRDFLASNELGLLHLLDLLRRRGHRPRVVFPSTRLVYQGREASLAEEAPKEAKSVYAASKLAAEAILQAYWTAYGIPYTVYRICVPYGHWLPGRYSYGTLGAFFRMAAENKKITLFGDGSLRRTFTHVEDLCTQILATALLPETAGQILNVGGETASLQQVASWVAARQGVSVEHIPWPDSEWAIESGDTVFDDTRIRRYYPAPLKHTLHDWIARSEPGT